MDFGLLPELSQKSLPIKLLNKGTYQVPIKFILSQVCLNLSIICYHLPIHKIMI
jgi:hypothetical protein